MINVMKLIEIEMDKLMPELGVKFVLVGSIVEGTRIYEANELDVMMQFKGLYEKPLILQDDPFELEIEHDHKHPLGNWCENSTLKYEKFFAHILETLAEIIKRGGKMIERKTNGRIRSKPQMSKHVKCDGIYGKRSQSTYLTHCIDCLSSVTFTKCGACLVFKYKVIIIECNSVKFQKCPIRLTFKNTNFLRTISAHLMRKC